MGGICSDFIAFFGRQSGLHSVETNTQKMFTLSETE